MAFLSSGSSLCKSLSARVALGTLVTSSVSSLWSLWGGGLCGTPWPGEGRPPTPPHRGRSSHRAKSSPGVGMAPVLINSSLGGAGTIDTAERGPLLPRTLGQRLFQPRVSSLERKMTLPPPERASQLSSASCQTPVYLELPGARRKSASFCPLGFP